MRSILFFLIFSLMKGCEAKSQGCREEWDEFNKKSKVPGSNKAHSRQTDMDEWENKDSISLQHDSKTKTLTVEIKQCKSTCTADGEELILRVEKDDCLGPFNQIAYKTTINFDYPGGKNGPSVNFVCKDNMLICEDILTKSSSKSNRRFTLSDTSSDFRIHISNVSKRDAGVYWCEENTSDGCCRVTLKSMKLKVEGITFFKKSPTIGQNLTYYCTFRNETPIEIFICKGEDPSTCQHLVTSTQPDNTGKFSMKRSKFIGQSPKTSFNISITVREVTAKDSGIYWCGAESKDETHSNLLFHKFLMTVGPKPTPTSRVYSTELNTSAPAKGNDGLHMLITVTVSVFVLLLLLFMLILILIYKRFSHSKNTRNGATAQNIKEDYIYEEIQERIQNPDSGDAVNSVYATANFPTNPSASLNYSTVAFKNCSNKVKPRSACEYSTVKYSESPVYSTVNKPSRSSQDPLYSTVTNKY